MAGDTQSAMAKAMCPKPRTPKQPHHPVQPKPVATPAIVPTGSDPVPAMRVQIIENARFICPYEKEFSIVFIAQQNSSATLLKGIVMRGAAYNSSPVFSGQPKETLEKAIESLFLESASMLRGRIG